MIKLNPRPPAPPYLNSQTVLDKKRELAERVAAGETLKSRDFSSYWLNENVREPLWSLHHRKCCYCERKRGMKRESDIEHFRPKSMVSGEDEHPGYWWLAYEWTNYLFSCKPCNEDYKKNHFPLLPDSQRASKPDDDLDLERPVLLNPIDDDPETCISYDWWSAEGIYVMALGKDEDKRGLKTIEILGLNNKLLMEERAENFSLLKSLAHTMIQMQRENNNAEIDKCAADIQQQTSAKRDFAGFKRAYFRAAGLADYVSDN